MNRPWLSAAELAGLPGMPGTARNVNRMGDRGELQRRKKLRGKGWEYSQDSLPKPTRDYLLRKAAADVVTQEVAQPPAPLDVPTTGELSDWQREQMNDRLAILSIIDEMALHMNQGRAIDEFIGLADTGELPEPTLAALHRAKNSSKGKHLVNRATLYRWFELRTISAAALAPKPRRGKAHHTWLPMLLKLYQVPQKPSISECIRDWSDYYPNTSAPTLRTAQRQIAQLPSEIVNYGRMGKNALRSVQPFVRRTFDGLWPMDVVTVDGHLFKAYVRHPLTGRRFRPELTTYMDIATRKAVGFSSWIAESQFAIWGALRQMVTNPECGVGALHYSDNGAYRSEQHRATLSRIGTSIMFSEAYRAQARGVIERFNSSVWIPLAKKLPLYCGDDMDPQAFRRALKKADESGDGLPGWQDFVAGCQLALEKYNDRSHRSLGGRSPNQAWAQAITEGWKPTLLGQDDLHDLMPSEERKVNRGEISLPWGRYFHKDLSLYHGQQVRAAFEPTDGSQIWVSSLNGELICVAERDANARPYVSESMLEHARARREKGRLDRLERKIDAVREEGAAQIEARPADPVLTELAERTLASMREEFDAMPAFIVPPDDPQRYALWKELDAKPTPLTDEERAFYERFKDADYCRNMLQMEAEFNEALSQ